MSNGWLLVVMAFVVGPSFGVEDVEATVEIVFWFVLCVRCVLCFVVVDVLVILCCCSCDATGVSV